MLAFVVPHRGYRFEGLSLLSPQDVAIGPSRGASDPRPDAPARAAAVIRLNADNVSDVSAADEVLTSARPLSRLIDDKGCDANRLRSRLKADGSTRIIPGRHSRTTQSQSSDSP